MEISYQEITAKVAADAAGYLLGKGGVPKHAIITALAGSPTPNLDAFVEAVKVGGRVGTWGESCQAPDACRFYACRAAGVLRSCDALFICYNNAPT
jgi:hypothetical protein